MQIFDALNKYIQQHPAMLDQLEFAFRIKWWLLLVLAAYFLSLPYREQKKRKKKPLKKGQFLA